MLIDDRTWSVRCLSVDTSNCWVGQQMLVAPKWIEGVSWADGTDCVNLTRQAVSDRPACGPGQRLNLVLLEGRHSAGKEGAIKRIVAHLSPGDTRLVALEHRDAHSAARDAMLLGSPTAAAPCQVVRTDSKRHARLNLMRDILNRLHGAGRSKHLVAPDGNIVFEFTPDCVARQRLAR